MLAKYFQAFTLVTALSAGSFAVAEEGALNPFQPADINAIGAGVCFDYYPLFLGGFAGYESILALSCLRDGGCVFDICAVPAGQTQVQCSYGNVWGSRELRFLSASNTQLILLKSNYGQVWIFDGSAGGNSVGASRHYLFSGGSPFSVEIPESNCSLF